MWLKRLDAIASGIIAIGAGIAIVTVVWGIAGEDFQAAGRQKEALGTVVGQATSNVCRRTERGNPLKCVRMEKVACPIVQYQPETGPSLKIKDCFQSLNLGLEVYVVYDSKAPADARISLAAGSKLHWFPLIFAIVPLGTGALLLLIGIFRFWAGMQMRDK
ncbi:MAG: hypothetical protein NW220_10870 [Leptolyngbyaceae cyanobacterium bins.349]|nr:hypothetical protein [Leptolyngbyaceae cyanobacterium bins.349]